MRDLVRELGPELRRTRDSFAALADELRAAGDPECAAPLAELDAEVAELSELVREDVLEQVRTLREHARRAHRLAGDAARTVDDVRFAEAVGGAVLALDRALDPGRRTTWGGHEEGPGSLTSR
jgi:hypothetical protein